jgi:hypothetical protein
LDRWLWPWPGDAARASGRARESRIFGHQLRASLAEPFVGVRTAGCCASRSAPGASPERRDHEDRSSREAFQDNLELNFAGATAASFSPEQKSQLIELIGLYVGNMRDPHAKDRMAEVVAHLDDTRFAWVGTTSDDGVFYYRMRGPVLLIEFDHQRPVGTTALHPVDRPTRDHIHAIVRTPNGNDYGKDVLRQHLLTEHWT